MSSSIVMRICEVAEIVNGGTPETSKKENWGGEHLWITPKDMGKAQSIYVEKTERTLTDAGLKNSSAKLLPVNSIILSSRAPIGHLLITKRETATNQGCKGLVPKKNVFPKYLYYFLLKSVDLLNDLGSGTTFKELSGSKLAEVKIPVPPLDEQQRIVAKLDKAFAAIDQAKINTEKNLENMHDLFKTILQYSFDQKIIGKIEFQKLENIVDENSQITYGVVKPGNEGNVLFIRGGDLVDGHVLIKQLRTITEKVSLSYKRTLLLGGELLISLVGQPGQVAVAPEELRGANIARQVGLIRLQPKMNPNYVRYYLQSPLGQRALGARQSGSVQQVINLGELRQVEVPMLPIDGQNEIVEKLNATSNQIIRIGNIFRKKIMFLDELKKSILQQAFNGEL